MSLTLSDQPVLIERVLVGEDDDPSRRGSKQLVARSECRFDCSDNETLDRCVEALRQSDENLRMQPQHSAFYDWQSAHVQRRTNGGGFLTFGIAWYDQEFFDAKRDVYLSPLHHNMFERIGMEAGSISICHWKFIGEAAR